MIYLLLAALAIGILFYAVIASKSATKPNRRRPVNKTMVAGRWQTIMQMASTGGNGLRTAVSEADKLFDHVLREAGFKGNTMADRLRSAKGSFAYATYDSIWQAHKLRNALAHEVGFDLVKSQADEALQNFEKGLKELGAL